MEYLAIPSEMADTVRCCPCSEHVKEFMEVCSALGLVGEVWHGRGGIWWVSMKSAVGGIDARFRVDGKGGRGGIWMRTHVSGSAEAACLGMLRDMASGHMSVEVVSRTFSVPPFSCVGELRMKAMMMGL